MGTTRLHVTKTDGTSAGIDIEDVQHAYQHSGKNYFGYAYSLTSSSDSAKDIVQHVFAKLIAKIKRDGNLHVDSLEAYVIRAIRNEHIDRISADLKHSIPIEKVSENVHSAEVVHFDNMRNNSLSKAIQKLPTAQRTCIVMYYYDNMKVDEIARSLKISKSAVKTHIQRGRGSLAKHLENEDLGDAL